MMNHLRVRKTTKRRELFVQRQSLAFMVFLLVSALAMLVLYTVFDNQRVRVDHVDVSVPTLPRALNGYTLLVISDLHDKIFETGQSGITRALGTANYDAVIFLGDMTGRDVQDPAAFYALIDALAPSGKPMFYVKGNHDPDNWQKVDGQNLPSAYLQGMLDRSVQLLDRPYLLKGAAEGKLWLWPLDRVASDPQAAIETAEANIERELARGTPGGLAEAAYNEMLIEQYEALIEAREAVLPEDIHIAARHEPATPSWLSLMEDAGGPSPTVHDMDLLLAGHYHAGQYRFPPFGAVAVPAPTLPRGGWFPDQEQIAGLSRLGYTRQYISRGLGASGPKPLRFRLFNTPEVTLLKLTSRVE